MYIINQTYSPRTAILSMKKQRFQELVHQVQTILIDDHSPRKVSACQRISVDCKRSQTASLSSIFHCLGNAAVSAKLVIDQSIKMLHCFVQYMRSRFSALLHGRYPSPVFCKMEGLHAEILDVISNSENDVAFPVVNTVTTLISTMCHSLALT